MKVTFVLPKYPNKPAGGFRVVYEYANYLVSKGHEITIIHPRRLLSQPLPKGVVKKTKRIGQIFKSYIFKPTIPSKLEWQLIDPRVNLVYVPNLSERYIPCADAIVATAWHTADYVNNYCEKKGNKFYLIQHYEVWDGPNERVNKTWLYPMFKIVIAKWLMEIGRNLGAENMIHIPNAIDQTKFVKKVDFSSRQKKIAMLYHKSEWKGSDVGIEALEIAKKEIPELKAILFGVSARGDEIPDWIDYIQRPSQQELIDEVYNSSSVYLCPSYKEGWGLPAAESLACGCALVSTNNGGVQDFAEHGETALLSSPGNINELAENLINLLKDDKKRILIAEAGYKGIKSYTYDKSGELFEKYLIENSF
jgi:L-malate glycosyltransferase